jgi:signal transduction histidine kinase
MDDRFEKFIAENRENFDFREPDPLIWKKIKADVQVKQKFNWRVIMKRAAVVVLIFAASYVVNEMVHRLSDRGLNALKSIKGHKETTLPGLNEAEAYYTNIVNQKLDELKPIIANCPSLEKELNYDMSELDSVYHDLKTDLKDNMANQEVIEAIIENYRLKITILEDILTEITPLNDECISKTDGYAL